MKICFVEKEIVCNQLYIGVLAQLSPNGFLLQIGKVEHVALLLHHSEDAQLRDVALARGQGNILVTAQELQSSLHGRSSSLS